jgi:hypothetical protein
LSTPPQKGKPPAIPSVNVGGTRKMQWGNLSINTGLDSEQRKMQRAIEKETKQKTLDGDTTLLASGQQLKRKNEETPPLVELLKANTPLGKWPVASARAAKNCEFSQTHIDSLRNVIVHNKGPVIVPGILLLPWEKLPEIKRKSFELLGMNEPVYRRVHEVVLRIQAESRAAKTSH